MQIFAIDFNGHPVLKFVTVQLTLSSQITQCRHCLLLWLLHLFQSATELSPITSTYPGTVTPIGQDREFTCTVCSCKIKRYKYKLQNILESIWRKCSENEWAILQIIMFFHECITIATKTRVAMATIFFLTIR